MRTVSIATALALLFFAAAFVGSAADKPAQPAPQALELDLKRSSIENVDDKAGRWQFEGGSVFQNGKHVANYASTKRVVFQSTEQQNAAALTVTIFFLGKDPPENMTLQGTHSFNFGEQTGRVSAASGQYSAYIGKSFSTEGENITIK